MQPMTVMRTAVRTLTRSAAEKDSTLASQKNTLLSLCVGLNRGFNAREVERASISDLIGKICASQPNGPECFTTESASSAIAGEWKLMYTTALDVLSIGINPFVEIGQIYQNVNFDGSQVNNIIEIQPKLAPVLNRLIGSSLTRLTVTARGTPEGRNRIRISFSGIRAEGVSILGKTLEPIPEFLRDISVSFSSVSSAGYFDTIYLDDDLRISTGTSNSVFILCRP